jgi:hypothetical protein
LNVKLLVTEWGEGGCIEPPARVEVCHDQEHVIDDDAANRHWFTLSMPDLGSLPPEATRSLTATRAGLRTERMAPPSRDRPHTSMRVIRIGCARWIRHRGRRLGVWPLRRRHLVALRRQGFVSPRLIFIPSGA